MINRPWLHMPRQLIFLLCKSYSTCKWCKCVLQFRTFYTLIRALVLHKYWSVVCPFCVHDVFACALKYTSLNEQDPYFSGSQTFSPEHHLPVCLPVYPVSSSSSNSLEHTTGHDCCNTVALITFSVDCPFRWPLFCPEWTKYGLLI